MDSSREGVSASSSTFGMTSDGAGSDAAGIMRELQETMMAQFGQLDIWRDLGVDPRVQRTIAVATDEIVPNPTQTEVPIEGQDGLQTSVEDFQFDQTPGEVQQDHRGLLPIPHIPTVICSFCHLAGHTIDMCRRASGACLVCGSFEHRAAHCPASYRQQEFRDWVQTELCGLTAPQHSVRPQGSEEGTSGQRARRRSQAVSCNYCKKMGHTTKSCRKAQRTCLRCGSTDHRIAQCPIGRQRERVEVSAPPVPYQSSIIAVHQQIVPCLVGPPLSPPELAYGVWEQSFLVGEMTPWYTQGSMAGLVQLDEDQEYDPTSM